MSFKGRISESAKPVDRKIGWVLDVGGAKGVFQAGAMEALMDAGFTPDIIKGTSAGAINTSFMLGNGNHINGLKEVWSQMSLDKIFNLPWKKFRSLLDNTPLKEGIDARINTDLVFDNLNRKGTEVIIHSTEITNFGLTRKKALFATEKTYQKLKDIYKDDKDVVVYQLTKENFKQAVLSSGALPVIFPTESIDNKSFSDGGIFENRPSEDGKIALGSMLREHEKGISFVVLCHPIKDVDKKIDNKKVDALGITNRVIRTVVIAPPSRLGVKFLSFNKAGKESENYLEYGYMAALAKLKSERLITEEQYTHLVETKRNERFARVKFDMAA